MPQRRDPHRHPTTRPTRRRRPQKPRRQAAMVIVGLLVALALVLYLKARLTAP